jgi:hypothetical protein
MLAGYSHSYSGLNFFFENFKFAVCCNKIMKLPLFQYFNPYELNLHQLLISFVYLFLLNIMKRNLSVFCTPTSNTMTRILLSVA